MWHTTDQKPGEGAKVVAIRQWRVVTGTYTDGCVDDARPVSPLLSEFDFWAYAPGEVAECEYRRRRVDDELPEDGEMVVVGYDGCVSAFIVAKWAAGRWSVSGATFPRQDFDWWAPIPKETDHVAHD